MTTQQLHDKRQRLLSELGKLHQLRRGSLVEQFVTAKRKDGSQGRRGPYPLFTCKQSNKTLSKRLTNPEDAALYRQQIQAMRRFEQITDQLVTIGEQLANQALQESDAQKKTSIAKSSNLPR